MTSSIRIGNVCFLLVLVMNLLVPCSWFSSVSADGSPSTHFQTLQNCQQPIRIGALPEEYADSLVALQLEALPVELTETDAIGASPANVKWTAAYVSPELSSRSTEITTEDRATLTSRRTQVFMTVGSLSGPRGTVAAVALAFSVVDYNDNTLAFMVPITTAPASAVNSLAAIATTLATPVQQANEESLRLIVALP